MIEETEAIKLTKYSHGAGCGCKISPEILSRILHSNEAFPGFANLMVGNNARDDAAVLDIGNGQALISTTDFFMPIVDDPYDFGRIASANAISDVYAMGGKPVLAIAILGWPIEKLSPEVAQKVIEGSRSICAEAGIPLAGGHSIDSPEPIFGLAVNGIAAKENIKTNSAAKARDFLFLTKPLGIGILTTAEKKNLLKKEHIGLATSYMTRLNSIGEILGKEEWVHAITDVTGFGLAGHLLEMCQGSNLSATIQFNSLKLLPDLEYYISEKSTPGGTTRNWKSYGNHFSETPDNIISVIADPQTSGGLLVAVDENEVAAFTELLTKNGLADYTKPIGRLRQFEEGNKRVVVEF